MGLAAFEFFKGRLEPTMSSEAFLRGSWDAKFGLRQDGAIDESSVYYALPTGNVVALNLSCLSCGPTWTSKLRSSNAIRASVPFSALAPQASTEQGDPKHRMNSNHRCSRSLYLGGAHSLDACSGKLNWFTPLAYSESSDPIVAGESIFLGASSSVLYSLDAASGRVKFNTSFAGFTGATTTPAFSNRGMVFVATSATLIRRGPTDLSPNSHDGFLFSVNSSSGQIIWRYLPRHETSFLTGPVVSDEHETVYVPSIANSNDVYFLHAVNMTSGKQRWSFQTRSRITAKPLVLVAENQLFVAAADGTLSCLHLSDGAVLWESRAKQFDGSLLASPIFGLAPAGGRAPSSPVGARRQTNGRLYLATNAGSIYAVSQHSGNNVWRYVINPRKVGILSSPLYSLRPISSAGIASQVIVVGSLDGHVYALSERSLPTYAPTPVPTLKPSSSQLSTGLDPSHPQYPGGSPTPQPNPSLILSLRANEEQKLMYLLLLALAVAGFALYRRFLLARRGGSGGGGGGGGSLPLVQLGTGSLNPLHRAMNQPQRHVFSSLDWNSLPGPEPVDDGGEEAELLVGEGVVESGGEEQVAQ